MVWWSGLNDNKYIRIIWIQLAFFEVSWKFISLISVGIEVFIIKRSVLYNEDSPASQYNGVNYITIENKS